MIKKFLFATTLISISIISIAGHLYFTNQKPALAQIVRENIYISQSGNGSQDGSDCNNSRSVSWFNTAGNWANPKQAGKIGPGDTAHLCGVISTSLTVQGSGSIGAPITILFEYGAKFSAPKWNANTGAININGKSHIIIDGGINGIIEATDNGTTSVFGGTKTYSNSLYGIYLTAVNYVTVKNLIIRNIYDRLANSADCLRVGRGIQNDGQSSNLIVKDNLISEAFFGISDILTNSNTITVGNNIISNTSVGINIAPGNTSSTGSNINIYGNDVRGGTKYDGVFDANCQANGCSASCLVDKWHHQDGMHLFSQGDTGWVDSVNIFNNYLQDFGTHSTAHIYIEYHGMKNVKIYNNVLVNTGVNYAANGMLTVKAADGVKIYNNTITGAGNSNNQGIYFNSSGGISSQNADIKNNIISGVRTIIGWAVGTTWVADFNSFYNFSPSYAFYVSDNSWHNMSWWKDQGYDIHGKTNDPLLDIDFKPTIYSSAKDTGITLADFTTDKDGVSRPQGSAWDIGAYEYIQTPPPLKGDFNSDKKVNDLDFTDFKNAFKNIFNSLFDLNSDNTIDVKDLGVLMSGWLE